MRHWRLSFTFSINLKIKAVVRISLFNVDARNSIDSPLLFTERGSSKLRLTYVKMQLTLDSSLSTSTYCNDNCIPGSFGHKFEADFRQSGPFHHRDEFFNFSAELPRETKSAGFCEPGT